MAVTDTPTPRKPPGSIPGFGPGPQTTRGIMGWVLMAMLPGIIAMTSVWGLGVLWNVVLLSVVCAVAELAGTAARGTRDRQALTKAVGDGTALVTGWLIAIALPPYTHVGVLCVAGLAAVLLGKHAYGGTGRNVFNPAMVGYAVALVSFPTLLAEWPAIGATAPQVDTLSGATLLSEFRYRDGLTVAEFSARLGATSQAQQWVAWAFAAGGGLLMAMKLIAWRVPLALLAGVGIGALFGFDNGSSQSLGSFGFHLTSGGLMAAAFFVATDPVTHPKLPAHQIVFGLMIGLLIYLIRGFGVQPDAIAFAILLGNCVTPLLNRRAVGHYQQVTVHD